MEILEKFVKLLWLIALFVGISMSLKIVQTSQFVASSVKTNAKVEKIQDSEGDQRIHVLFLTRNRTYMRSSFKDTYIDRNAKTVEVLYNPAIPAENTLNDTIYIWYDVIVSGVIVAVSMLLAIIIRLLLKFYLNRHKRFMRQGSMIYTTYVGVEKKPLNGAMAYRIVSKWRDPSTSKQLLFRSKFLNFDPTDFILDNTISVIVNRKKSKYVMDLGFLPKKKLQASY